SYIAAKAALAVHSLHPEQYEAFHDALMATQGHLQDENAIAAVAKQLKMNWPAIQKKMQDPAIDKQLQANRQLAQQLGLTGTPAFVIGETILRGAPRTADDLRSLLKSKP
ncbi:MAG: DsbA family protein, partial [Aeromonadaceae bacterium]